MNILHVISSLDRKAGGPPVALAGLAIAQAKCGSRVSVAATFNPDSDRTLADELQSAGVAVSLIGPAAGKFQKHPDIQPTLIRLIAAADVVHIHTLWEEIQHQAAAISLKLRKPYVFVPHGMLDPWSLAQSSVAKRAYLALRLRRDLNGAMFIHALNADEARLIEPLRLRTKCAIIPNGFTPPEHSLPPPSGERAGVRGETPTDEPLPSADTSGHTAPTVAQRFPPHPSSPLRGEGPYILFLSRLHPKKGLDYLADAFAIVAAAHPNVRLIVAGPEDGAEKDFDARIAAAKLQDRVDRVGPLYGDEKLAAMSNASLFVLPSRQEGFSVAILEALACGTPVVISDQCHFPEVAEAGAGKVVSLDARAIADAMLQFLNDPAGRETASGNAKALAARYTWDRIAQKTLSLYGRPRVAILANSLPPYRVALHRRIVNEIPGVRLFSLYTHAKSNAPWEIDPPAEIEPVSFTHLRPLQQGPVIIRWIEQNRPSAVIVNGYNDAARMQVLSHCHRHGVPVMLWGDSNIRSDRVTGVKALIKSRIVRRAVRLSDLILPCGSLGQQYFEKYGADPKRIIWMPYEPDYELIRTISAEQIDQVRLRFHLPAGRKRLVYSGRLIGVKRVDLLLNAFEQLAPQRPDWDLVVVGDGPLHQSLQDSLPASIAQRVTWTGFLDDQQTVSAVYRACDVLVHPADIEPWALVINEAAAAGLAIVASDAVGAAAELVRDGVNGRIFPASDIGLLIDALLDVTAAANLSRYQAASAGTLVAWRDRADPVEAVWKVLHFVHVGYDVRRDRA